MITIPAGRVALITVLAVACGACSREQQDWRSAEAADTSEAYGRFLEQHADSELASQARERLVQLAEQRDWQHAGSAGTVEAYRQFLAHHPTGRWSEEARIRIEASALGSAPRIAPQTPEEAAVAPTGVRALQLATGTLAPPAQAAAPGSALAVPGEAALPADRAASGELAPARPLVLAGTAAGPIAQPGEAAQPAEAAQPIAVPVSRSTDGPPADGYGIQLGAFGSPASADREWQRLQGRFGAQLGGLSPRIVPASTTAGQLYRLQVAAAGEAQARAICDSLREQSQACVPVLPR